MDSPTSVFVVADEVKEVGEFERQLTATLYLCQITELTSGWYVCAINRSRDGNITEVWSANVLPAQVSITSGKSYCVDLKVCHH